jgi:hypothetical protein
VDIQKTFYLKNFFQNYASTLTNPQKTKIKKYFIQLIKMLKEYELVNYKYTIISDGKVYDTDQLTSLNISEGFIVHEKLSEMFINLFDFASLRLLWGKTT